MIDNLVDKKNVFDCDFLSKLFLILMVTAILVFDFTIIYQVITIISALYIIISAIINKRKIKFTFFLYTYSLLVIFAIFHTIVIGSLNVDKSIDYCVTMMVNLLFIFVINNLIISKNDIIIVFNCFIVVSILLSIYSLIVNKGEIHMPVPYFWISGTYSHNSIPIILSFSSLFIVWKVFKDKGNKILLMLIPLFFIFIIVSQARKSLILFFISTIIYPIFFIHSKKLSLEKILFRGIILVLIAFIVLNLIMVNDFLYENIGHRFEGFIEGFFGGEYTEGSAISRDIMLEEALKLFSLNPIFGSGLYSFASYSIYGTWCHNNYLEMVTSCGVFFLIIYYSFHIKYIKNFFKEKKHDSMSTIFLIVILYYFFIHDLLSVSFYDRQTLLLFTIASILIRKKRHIACKSPI